MLPALLVALAAAPIVTAAEVIPRQTLFAGAERSDVRLSPDGKLLAFISVDAEQRRQLWLRDLSLPELAPVRIELPRSIREYLWAADSTGVIVLHDADADGARLSFVDKDTRAARELTVLRGARASLLATSAKVKDAVLVTLSANERRLPDVQRISLKTGAAAIDTRNPGDVRTWVVDSGLLVRAAVASTAEGGTELKVRDNAKQPWRSFIKAGPEEVVALHGFTLDGKGAYVATSVDSDTSRLVEKSLSSGTERVIAKNDVADVDRVLWHPTKYAIQAVRFEATGRQSWVALDSGVKADLDALASTLTGDVSVVSRDDADALWVVAERSDRTGVAFHLWERASKRITLLFAERPQLQQLPLVTTQAVAVPARDGVSLPGALSLPAGVANQKLPLLLVLQPSSSARREPWGYQALPQLFANRGYAVMQLIVRGAHGFGKRFAAAPDGPWSRMAIDDAIDAARWVTAQGLADPKRICLAAFDEGGAAAMTAAALSPDLFRCMIAWGASASATAAAPVTVDQLRTPVLLGVGAETTLARQADTDRLVSLLQNRRVPVTVVQYPDEGATIQVAANRLDFTARAEAFVAKHLGGQFEPLPEEGRVPGSSAKVKVIAAGP